MKKVLISIVFLAIIFPSVPKVFAAKDIIDLYGPPQVNSSVGFASKESIINFLKNALTWISRIFWIVAIAMILYAAFMYLTAGANEANVDKAKNVLKFAIIGMVIALVSGVIPALIENVISGGGGGVQTLPQTNPNYPTNILTPGP